jgi:DNA replicative helicase MCM subunit Mcm2 (Cdc46/Mcm family)
MNGSVSDSEIWCEVERARTADVCCACGDVAVQTISPQKNVHLPDSLLSRFDLMFIVQDVMDESRDKDIADHVRR